MSHDTRSNGGKSSESRMDLLKPDMQPQRILQSEQDIWDLVKIRIFCFRAHIEFAVNAEARPTNVEFFILLFFDEKFQLQNFGFLIEHKTKHQAIKSTLKQIRIISFEL